MPWTLEAEENSLFGNISCILPVLSNGLS